MGMEVGVSFFLEISFYRLYPAGWSDILTVRWSDILIARDNPRAVQREFLVINQSTEPKNQRSIIRTLGLAAHSFSSSLGV